MISQGWGVGADSLPLALSCPFCQDHSSLEGISSASSSECLWKPGTVTSLSNFLARVWNVIYVTDCKCKRRQGQALPAERRAGWFQVPCREAADGSQCYCSAKPQCPSAHLTFLRGSISDLSSVYQQHDLILQIVR